MHIIDGRLESGKILSDLKIKVSKLVSKGITPNFSIILIGNNEASEIYVNTKIKKAKEIGVLVHLIRFDINVSQADVIKQIEDLNKDDNIHGIIVQLPVPPHISQEEIQSSISPIKDIDAFHPYNVGRLYSGSMPYFISPTPLGCYHLIKTFYDDISGVDIVVVGKSNIVGKPLASLLMNDHATVTICHSLTKNLSEITKKADIVVLATGASEFFGKEYFDEGQIVIDVGISKTSDGRTVGDVRFDEVKEIVSSISPVPGGVGPMTIAYLLNNCVIAASYGS